MITYRCGRCSILVQTPTRNAGKPVTCKQCQHVTICPPNSMLVPLRPPKAEKKTVGSPAFWATVSAVGLARVALALTLNV